MSLLEDNKATTKPYLQSIIAPFFSSVAPHLKSQSRATQVRSQQLHSEEVTIVQAIAIFLA